MNIKFKAIAIGSIALAIVGFAPKVMAQTTDSTAVKLWKKGGAMAVNFSQVSLTNWASGGQNSISVNSILNAFANYRKDKIYWDNLLDMGYGVVRQGNNGWQKSDDKIEVNTKFGRDLHSKWSYMAQLNFRTQFVAGYNYPNDSVQISNFMSPGYILISTGFDYKPNANFSLALAPVAGRVTVVNDQTLADAGAFGVEKAQYDANGIKTVDGKMARYEFGASLTMLHKAEIMKNVSYQNKLQLFTNYLDRPQNVDVNWEMLFNAKINKYLSANLLFNLIYDHDIQIEVRKADGTPKLRPDGTAEVGPRAQFKNVFGAGFAYKFLN